MQHKQPHSAHAVLMDMCEPASLCMAAVSRVSAACGVLPLGFAFHPLQQMHSVTEQSLGLFVLVQVALPWVSLQISPFLPVTFPRYVYYYICFMYLDSIYMHIYIKSINT